MDDAAIVMVRVTGEEVERDKLFVKSEPAVQVEFVEPRYPWTHAPEHILIPSALKSGEAVYGIRLASQYTDYITGIRILPCLIRAAICK